MLEPGDFAALVEKDEEGLLKVALAPFRTPLEPRKPDVPASSPAPQKLRAIEEPSKPDSAATGSFNPTGLISKAFDYIKGLGTGGLPSVPSGGLGDSVGKASWSLGGTGYGGGAGPGGFYSRRTFDSQGWGKNRQKGGIQTNPWSASNHLVGNISPLSQSDSGVGKQVSSLLDSVQNFFTTAPPVAETKQDQPITSPAVVSGVQEAASVAAAPPAASVATPQQPASGPQDFQVKVPAAGVPVLTNLWNEMRGKYKDLNDISFQDRLKIGLYAARYGLNPVELLRQVQGSGVSRIKFVPGT